MPATVTTTIDDQPWVTFYKIKINGVRMLVQKRNGSSRTVRA